MRAKPPRPPELMPAETSWQLLVSEFSGHPFLDGRTLYTLPKRLIQSVREHAPKVLSEDDAQFEMRLRSLGGTGLYRKEPMLSQVLDGHLLDSDEFDQAVFANWQHRKSEELYNQFRDVLASDLLEPFEIERRRKVEDAIRTNARVRLRGYLGWLITSQTYWQNVVAIRTQHHEVFRQLGEHSTLASPSPNERQRSRSMSQAIFDTQQFLSRWNLVGYTTFCIPEPCLPTLFVGDRRSEIQQDGISLFIPWCLLHGDWLPLRRLRDYHNTKTNTEHLSGWLRKRNALAYVRCARLADLYVYFELGLQARYGDQIKRQIAPLQRAFAAYLKVGKNVEKGSESVRKLWQLLRKRMRNCAGAMPE